MNRFAEAIIAVYRKALLLYPEHFREEFGDEMCQVFEEAISDAAAEGWSTLLIICFRELRDGPRMLLTQHWQNIQRIFRRPQVDDTRSTAPRPGLAPVEMSFLTRLTYAYAEGNPQKQRRADLLIATTSLIVLFPAFLFISLLIKLDSRGPLIYRQQRVDDEGKPFVLYKFRSMTSATVARDDAPPFGSKQRITRVGQWIRKWHLDETPQLFNVLKGEMSIVGARPKPPQA